MTEKHSRNTLKDMLSISPPGGAIYLSWGCFFMSWCAPFCEKREVESRFFSIATSQFVIYSLLATFYEALFFLALVAALYAWIRVECKHQVKNKVV